MNTQTVLNKVRELLGIPVELEQRKLEDGVTVVEADAFEPDAEVFIVTEDEQKIALPIGEYKMEDGMILIVKEEGIISELKEAEEEKEEEVVEEEVGEEPKEEEMNEEVKPVKKTVESIVKETFFQEIKALKEENENLKAEIELLSKPEITEDKKEESENEVNLEAETLEPAADKINHNPENVEEKEVFKFKANRPKTLMDNIFTKLNK